MSNLQVVKKQLFNSEEALKAILPKDFDVMKFMATFFMEVKKNPKLASCNNIIDLAKVVATFNLTVGTDIGQCYIIPYGNAAKLIIGYKGYITKLEEQGYSVEVETVTHEEIAKGCFQELRGSNPQIIHNPIRTSMRTKENIALVYCIITGGKLKPRITVLSREEAEEKAKNNGKLGNVWTANVRSTDYGEMVKKTAIRDCAKKVNIGIVNKMSDFEGRQDQEIKDITPVNEKPKAETLDDVIALFDVNEDDNQKDVENTENMCDNADDYEKTVSDKKV